MGSRDAEFEVKMAWDWKGHLTADEGPKQVDLVIEGEPITTDDNIDETNREDPDETKAPNTHLATNLNHNGSPLFSSKAKIYENTKSQILDQKFDETRIKGLHGLDLTTETL